MIKISKADREEIIKRIYTGNIDAATLSTSTLVDDIILAMHKNNVLENLKDGFQDKRADNTTIPFELIIALAVAAKMRTNTSLTDVPYALYDHNTICTLGYSLWRNNKTLDTGLMSEGSIRFLIDKYGSDEFLNSYNNIIQAHIMKNFSIEPNIHILDCTKLEVNLKNDNYESSGIIRDEDGSYIRGYKLATLRGITKDKGIIEDIRFGAINVHDLTLSKEILMTSPVFNPNDILINDRGFLSRDIINHLKTHRKVDTYVPLKKNMNAYDIAVTVAKEDNKWVKHPNKKRTSQYISFVPALGSYWSSDSPDDDVELNGCVVWDVEDDKYFVFVTTDLYKKAAQIILTYELRPEIEEDYRQLKDFWKIEDFKSTKLNVIAFHITCTLLGYLFFQLYVMLPEGEKYLYRSLPVVLKNYKETPKNNIIIYSDDVFGVLTIFEMVQLYAQCDALARETLEHVLKQI